MHLNYLLLDEVMAGRGPAVYADIARAAAQLKYLLLPEVASEANCRGALAEPTFNTPPRVHDSVGGTT